MLNKGAYKDYSSDEAADNLILDAFQENYKLYPGFVRQFMHELMLGNPKIEARYMIAQINVLIQEYLSK